MNVSACSSGFAQDQHHQQKRIPQTLRVRNCEAGVVDGTKVEKGVSLPERACERRCCFCQGV
jgi:hypothetical protein